jgi:CRP-like cAMP-binding protein
MVAPANLFSRKEVFPVSLIAKGKTRLVKIDRKTLVKMFKVSEKLEENFLELLSDKVQFLANKLWENQFFSIEQRIYQMILELYKTKRMPIFDLPYTHEELSHRFGVSRPSFSRALIKINQDGVVLFKNKKVEIISVEKLRENLEGLI